MTIILWFKNYCPNNYESAWYTTWITTKKNSSRSIKYVWRHSKNKLNMTIRSSFQNYCPNTYINLYTSYWIPEYAPKKNWSWSITYLWKLQKKRNIKIRLLYWSYYPILMNICILLIPRWPEYTFKNFFLQICKKFEQATFLICNFITVLKQITINTVLKKH